MITISNLCRSFFLIAMTAFSYSGISYANNEDLTKPTVPLDQDSIAACHLTLLYPKMINDLACTARQNIESGSGLSIVYFRHMLENKEFYLHIEASVYQKDLNTFIEQGARGRLMKSDTDDHIIRSTDGLPQLATNELVGDCGQEEFRQVSATPITGPNWTGWMWEQSFAAPKKKLKASCQKFTPEYRCVALVFGNDKMSASFPTYCFLRKKVDNLDTELSFDVFMDMIKTIHFNEGSIESASGNMK